MAYMEETSEFCHSGSRVFSDLCCCDFLDGFYLPEYHDCNLLYLITYLYPQLPYE